MFKNWFISALNALIAGYSAHGTLFQATKAECLIIGGIAFTNTIIMCLYHDYKETLKK